MAEISNTFSWSHSAASDFEACRRKRYWSKYAMWGGWSPKASTEQQAAYRLNKMDNRYSVMGQAVEDSVMWILRQAQQGRDVTVEEAYEMVARDMLNKAWKDSKDGMWKVKPKQYICLHELYYPDLQQIPPEVWIKDIAAQVKTCLKHFIENTLPELRQIRREQEIEINTVRQGGDPEHFLFEGVKVYAIPDYVYVENDTWYIIDWKAGKPRPEHQLQVALYGLWAREKHGVPVDRVELRVEYLAFGKSVACLFTQELLDQVVTHMSESVGDMRDYLVDGDLKRNLAVPREEWDLAAQPGLCRMCNFYELCRPELKALGMMDPS